MGGQVNPGKPQEADMQYSKMGNLFYWGIITLLLGVAVVVFGIMPWVMLLPK